MQQPDVNLRAVKIILPRANDRDALAAEVFIAALAGSEPVTLEIAGVPGERMFILRGPLRAMTRALHGVRNAYPQCELVDLEGTHDPALLKAPSQTGFELRLRDPAYLPIRTHVSREGRATFDDFAQAADPMIGLLAAMDGLEDGESCLAQFTISPMGDDWARFWRGQANDVDARVKAAPSAISARLLTTYLIGAAVFGGMMLGLGILGRAPNLVVFGLIGLTISGALFGLRLRLPSPPDPALIQQKVTQSAFRVCARVFVRAGTPEAARERTETLMAAFRGYNLSGANGFVFVDLPEGALATRPDPAQAARRLPYIGFLSSPRGQHPILSVSELAGLWHLPHQQAAIQNVSYAGARRLVPVASNVTDGVWVGHSDLQGQRVEVKLPRAALRGNIGLIAKTQSGKSNLMAMLAADVIANDPDAAVIVIDPHRLLAQAVARLVPEARRDKTVYWSLADRERPFGLNLIDRGGHGGLSAEAYSDKRISDVIEAFREIWSDNWGPRMENYLRWPLLTLAAANGAMVADARFVEWHAAAFDRFVTLREPFGRGTPNANALAQVAELRSSFAALQRPSETSLQEVHGAIAHGFRAYDEALVEIERGQPDGAGALIAAIREVYRAAFVQHVPNANAARPMQYTILDVNPMLVTTELRGRALGAIDPETHRHIFDWWRDSYDAYRQMNARLLLEMFTPVTTKLARFEASDVARRIFGQPDSTIDLERLIADGGVLLLDLAAGAVGPETSALIGSTILNWVASILFAQADAKTRRHVFIVVDEFQSIPGADYAFMLSELAKYGAQLVMGTQSLDLLRRMNPKTAVAWLNNTSALFAFRSGAEDADVLARELTLGDENRLTVAPGDIVGLPDFACYARVQDEQRQPQVFRIDTRKVDDGDGEALTAIIEASRRTHGRNAREVDAWLTQASARRGRPDLHRAAYEPSTRAPEHPTKDERLTRAEEGPEVR